jgi:hypothetical protein
MEVSAQLHAPAALPSGKEPPYPLDRRLGGPQSRSRRGGEYVCVYVCVCIYIYIYKGKGKVVPVLN